VISRVSTWPVRVAVSAPTASTRITMETVFLETTVAVCTVAEYSEQDSKSKATVKHGKTLIYPFMQNVGSIGKWYQRFVSHSICGQGQWSCNDELCPGKCQVYGNGHYQTFDSKWYRFDGHCQYTLVEVRPFGGPLCGGGRQSESGSSAESRLIAHFASLLIRFRISAAPSLSEWRAFPAAMRLSPVLVPSSWTYRWTAFWF